MDKQTLRLIQQGDKTAFAALVERFQKPLFVYLGRMTLAQAVAEEIAQETFIRAWQARESFDEKRASVSTWLFTIARRLALNELDRAARRFEVADQSSGTGLNAARVNIDDTSITRFQSDQAQTNLAQTKQADPEQSLQQAELQTALRRALQKLPLQDRSLLALAYLKELEFSVIAEIEGIPVGTVKSRLHRIRQQLQNTLNGDAFHD
ncbi:sigma-70 family RNA polymerase sigma factor [Leucothrix pacifica]|uniref:RNA polymerase sigma factor n=1 Tax=Leucothrix pacifica TaxID=1247513 RepID=A0A317CE54_9GAMM|nr:sigma-70 family RNA polymerase sigma factor [Leucothrix pacifica]PWQ95603.1 hypothetical protein DKW60_14385 [Leucothrix pacifica]